MLQFLRKCIITCNSNRNCGPFHHFVINNERSFSLINNHPLNNLTTFHSVIRKTSTRWITLGISREEKNRWECRVPITPTHVKNLLTESSKNKIIIQPCNKRVYPNETFSLAGAVVNEDLSSCDIIVGVKEIPINQLFPDYELLTNSEGHRTVMFGAFAGYAGTINSLHGLGDRLLLLGYKTPFLNLGLAHHYLNLADAKLAIQKIGQDIIENGLPTELGPIIFCVTGAGNVSKGALEMLKLLPCEFVKPDQLADLCRLNFDRRKIYCVHATAEDYIKHDGVLNVVDFYANPSKYASLFHEKIAPYISVLINGIYWDKNCPRLLTKNQLQRLSSSKNCRLVSIADISCDLNGSIEFMDYVTSIERPFFTYDPITKKRYLDNPSAPGIQIMSVDNLPTQLPKDASDYFGNALYPYLSEMLKSDLQTLPKDVERSLITIKGDLVPKYQTLKSSIQEASKIYRASQSILLLGSGLVSGPFIDYFRKKGNVELVIASNSNLSLYENMPNIKTKQLDVQDKETLDNLVTGSNIVVSLLPAPFHPMVAEMCIKHKKNLVTASYVSPEIKALHSKAEDAGIVILNEIGLDPGIDHLAAMSIIDSVKESGGKVKSFVSWCGGLPAPEYSENPFGYKFSWSPRGALVATMNDAKYRKEGQIVEISGGINLMKSAIPLSHYRGFNFEGIPNRDSIKYESIYGLDDTIMKSMFRGTLRYRGYANLIAGFLKLGILDLSAEKMQMVNHCSTWTEAMKILLQSDTHSFADAIYAKLNDSSADAIKIYDALQWLGAFSLYEPFDKKAPTLLDSFCTLLASKLKYEKGERDMVFLSHSFVIENGTANYPNTQGEGFLTSTLVSFGDENNSAMAKTVGLPTAIATDLILNGTINQKGVIVPTIPSVYKPILALLEKEGIKFVEKQSPLSYNSIVLP